MIELIFFLALGLAAGIAVFFFGYAIVILIKDIISLKNKPVFKSWRKYEHSRD